VVQGYLNYHAVRGNLKRLGAFRAEVCRAWMHALRRRSQRTRMTWDRFKRLVAHYIPKVRSRHPHPNQRFASRHHPRQEPYAVIPHVRICAGGAG
jgi:RNA-directed DNA polymerase